MTKYFKKDPYLFIKDTIDGVPLYYKHISTAPCVHIKLVFDYGAMHDEIGIEGSAHFLEHCILKGSDLIEDEKAYREFSKSYTLGTGNANTSLYNMQIVGKCLPKHVEHVLNVYFSFISSPKLDNDAVESEKKVIIQELWRYYTNEKYLNYITSVRENNLFNIPEIIRTNSIIGWVDSIKKITREDLMKAKNKYLVKSNLKIYIAGNLDNIEDIKKIIKKNLENVSVGEVSLKPNVPQNIEKPKKNLFEHTYEEIGLGDEEQATIEMEVMIPVFDSKVKLHKIAIQRLLSSVMNDLAFEKLRTEHKLCYSAGCGMSSSVTFQSMHINSKLDATNITKAIELMEEIIEGVKTGLYEEKFIKNKELIINRFIANERSTNDILDGAVNDYVRYGEAILLDDLIEEMENVTYQDTVDFSNQYLQRDQFVLEIIKPKNIIS